MIALWTVDSPSPRLTHFTLISLSYNSKNYLIKVDNEEISAPYATPKCPREDYSKRFDDFVNFV